MNPIFGQIAQINKIIDFNLAKSDSVWGSDDDTDRIYVSGTYFRKQ